MQELKNFHENISELQIEQFEIFKANLLDWNSRMNLTTITDDLGILHKHFLDSLTLLDCLPSDLPNDFSMVDIGCGAGFPGLPIKIMQPKIKLTLVDSLRKRIFFLEDTIAKLQLANISCFHERAEILAKNPEHRQKYDICTARAVAPLQKLTEWCLPFIKQNGTFLAMKGPNVYQEIQEAKSTIASLNAEITQIKKIEVVPNLNHTIIIIKNKLT
ncbi:MAG: 16S rRNA (guanine(527)-N(7))-methyltransferase RsmG [Firmicutes bacterium]|nr:16S rRNA (guanine(527)-N(7))-methyltransferase RsmG [Bacillota bacterium]